MSTGPVAAAPRESKFERHEEEIQAVAEDVAAAEAVAAAAELAPALSSLRLEQEQEPARSLPLYGTGSKCADSARYANVTRAGHQAAGRGLRRSPCVDGRGNGSGSDSGIDSGSNSGGDSSYVVDGGRGGRGGGKMADTNTHDNPNTRGLEMDEMDEILLGLDRGPPPPRFLCGLTGNVISDPICHPRGNIWVEREALEAYVEDRSADAPRLRWPGAPDEPFMPKAGVGSLPTDRALQLEILAWQLRKR